MASVETYIYQVERGVKESDLLAFLHDSLYITTSFGDIKFIYDPLTQLMHPVSIPDRYIEVWPLDPLTPRKFLALLSDSHFLVYHSSARFGHRLVDMRIHFDYSKTIDELEKAGRVKTVVSKNYLANDPRKFSFVNDQQNCGEYEVDCLGTKLCQDITDLVVEAWIDIQPK